MSNRNDGGPAFPQDKRKTENYMDEGGYGRSRVVTVTEGGMTPLDKAKALLDARRKTTKGEWLLEERAGHAASFRPVIYTKEADRVAVFSRGGCDPRDTEGNAAFTALAANHAEAICNRLVELEKNYPLYKAHYDLCFPPKGTPASEIEVAPSHGSVD